MIKRINEAQTDALKYLETIRDEIESINRDDNTSEEEKKEKIYARVFAKRCLTILQIEEYSDSYKNKPSPINFYLLDTDFYMRPEPDWLFFNYALHTIEEGYIRMGERVIQLPSENDKSSEKNVVMDTVRIKNK